MAIFKVCSQDLRHKKRPENGTDM